MQFVQKTDNEYNPCVINFETSKSTAMQNVWKLEIFLGLNSLKERKSVGFALNRRRNRRSANFLITPQHFSRRRKFEFRSNIIVDIFKTGNTLRISPISSDYKYH